MFVLIFGGPPGFQRWEPLLYTSISQPVGHGAFLWTADFVKIIILNTNLKTKLWQVNLICSKIILKQQNELVLIQLKVWKNVKNV